MDIKKLMDSMTIDEKIGQLVQLTTNFFDESAGSSDTGPLAKMNATREQVNSIGSTLNFVGADNMKKVQDLYLKNSSKKIPLLFMQDVIHGYRTIYPISLGLAASFNPELERECAEMAAYEASLGGVNVTFGPMVDLARDARWGRVMETSGEDPYLNSVMAKSTVLGYQGNLDLNHVAACTKHFAAYGAPVAGKDYNTVDMSEYTLRNYYLPAYKSTVDADVKMFMTSFNTLNGIPSTVNKHLTNDILRDEWGFDGILITDYNAIREMLIHGYIDNECDGARLSMESGVDIEMMSITYFKHLKELVEAGKISKEAIDKACYRVLKLKDELGLFENPYRNANQKKLDEVVCSKSHREIARRAAIESAVLLKNDGILPLSKDLKKVSVIGPLASDGNIMGFWRCCGNSNDTITIYEGIKNMLPNAIVTTADGCSGDIYATDESSIEEAVEVARGSEAVILCLGELQDDTGEGNSKQFLDLTDLQYKLFAKVSKVNKNVVVLLFTGRPLAITKLNNNARAILNMWFPGTEGGNAAANLLFGDEVPSGKITMTFPYSVGQCPIYYNEYNTGRPRNDDTKRYAFKSTYIDGPNKPLYPFGYGLSYSKFTYSKIQISKSEIKENEKLIASVEVKNEGKYLAKEIVELYIRDLVASVIRPVKELKGFKKITLKPGEVQTVSFEISVEDLKFYDANLNYTYEKGEFEVFIGPDSTTNNKMSFKLI